MQNVLTKKSNDFTKLTSVFSAKVKDDSDKILSDILKIEYLKNENRYDSSNQHLINYEVIEKNGKLALKNNKTQRIYYLTKTAILNLFSKIGYISTKLKKSFENNFDKIIPDELKLKIIERYNQFYYKNKINSLSDIKNTTFFTLSKIIPTETIIQILNYNLKNADVGKELYQIKFQKVGDVAYIRAILDLKYKNFNITDMLETLQVFLSDLGGWRVVYYYSDIFGDNFNLRISKKIQNKTTVNKVGEPLEYSLTINTSNTGRSSLNASISVTVLKCLNGMVGLDKKDSFELIHNRNDKDAFKNALSELLRQAKITWKNIEEKYNLSKNIMIPDAEKLINSICKDYSLGQEVSKKILNTYRKELLTDNLPSLFHLTDAFTEVAHKHYNINQDGFHRLEKLGSDILINHEKFMSALQN